MTAEEKKHSSNEQKEVKRERSLWKEEKEEAEEVELEVSSGWYWLKKMENERRGQSKGSNTFNSRVTFCKWRNLCTTTTTNVLLDQKHISERCHGISNIGARDGGGGWLKKAR